MVALATLVGACAPEATAVTVLATPTSTAQPDRVAAQSTAIALAPSPASPSLNAPVSTPAPSCQDTAGHIEIGQAQGPSGSLLTYRVYTPPCLHPAGGKLPLLVLFHGLSASDSQWEELGVGAQADALINAHQAPPFLILMPREDTGADMEAELLGSLLPLVESTYLAGGDRSLRAVGGLSRGAGWALRIGLKHPDLFGAIGLNSPAVLSPDLYYLPAWAKAIRPGQVPRLSIDIGQEDTLLPAARDLTALLDSLSVPYEWHLNPGEHTRAYWSSHLSEYLRWYVAGWTSANASAPALRATPTEACGCR